MRKFLLTVFLGSIIIAITITSIKGFPQFSKTSEIILKDNLLSGKFIATDALKEQLPAFANRPTSACKGSDLFDEPVADKQKATADKKMRLFLSELASIQFNQLP